jgi:hypothetical protein
MILLLINFMNVILIWYFRSQIFQCCHVLERLVTTFYFIILCCVNKPGHVIYPIVLHSGGYI